jgi:hypothetical protein
MIANQSFSLAPKAVLYDIFGGAMVKLYINCPALFLPRKGQQGSFPVQQLDFTLRMIQNELPTALRETKIQARKIRKRLMGMFALLTTIDLADYLLRVKSFGTC